MSTWLGTSQSSCFPCEKTYIFEVLDAVQVAAEKGLDVSGCDGFIHKGVQLGEDEHEDGCSAGCFIATGASEETEAPGEDPDKAGINQISPMFSVINCCRFEFLYFFLYLMVLSDSDFLPVDLISNTVGDAQKAALIQSGCGVDLNHRCNEALFALGKLDEFGQVNMNPHGVDPRRVLWDGEGDIRVWSLKNSGFSQGDCADEFLFVFPERDWAWAPRCQLTHCVQGIATRICKKKTTQQVQRRLHGPLYIALPLLLKQSSLGHQ